MGKAFLNKMKFTHAVLLLSIAAFLLTGCAGSSAEAALLPEFVGRIQGERTPEKYQATAQNIAREFGAEYVKSYEGAEAFFLFRMTAKQAARVEADPRVQSVDPKGAVVSCSGRLEGGKHMSDAETLTLAQEVCDDFDVDLYAAFLLGFFAADMTPDQAALMEADPRVEEMGIEQDNVP